MIVVKVGGSLYDHPRLGPGLRAYLDALAPGPVLLVPGGGPFADAVRQLDAAHRLGEDAAHWLAIRAMDMAAAFLEGISNPSPGPSPKRGGEPEGGGRRNASELHPLAPPSLLGKGAGGLGQRLRLLNCFQFATEDETRPDPLPHSWAVTSDSIAARAAVVYRAERLILLKSIDIPPGTPWADAAAAGWVDPHFPRLVAAHRLTAEAVNFRRVLDSGRA